MSRNNGLYLIIGALVVAVIGLASTSIRRRASRMALSCASVKTAFLSSRTELASVHTGRTKVS